MIIKQNYQSYLVIIVKVHVLHQQQIEKLIKEQNLVFLCIHAITRIDHETCTTYLQIKL